MIEKLRQKVTGFITSPKDAPLLAGLAIGLYMIIYYYSKNLALAASWEQLLFFTGYYLVVPTVVLFLGYKVFSLPRLLPYRSHFLFVSIPLFLAAFLLQLTTSINLAAYIFAAVTLVLILASIKFSQFYKLFVVLLLFLSIFNVKPILSAAYTYVTISDGWKQQPDGILTADFKKLPNVYYIQPDGFTNKANLDAAVYNMDNHEFEAYLTRGGFVTYPTYRSNYNSTLMSNSSMMSMKHHYLQADIEKYNARDIIMGNNAVLQVFKHNGYQTHFITERPYLLMSRPKVGYDTANFSADTIPYLKDAWDDKRDVIADFKNMKTAKGPQFYFFEKMLPGHISVYGSKGIEQERKAYLTDLKKSCIWIKQLVAEIEKKDPLAIIVIAADHGGYVGFETTISAVEKPEKPLLVKSIYGALCAIKWNSEDHAIYDKKLKTSVNLFRVLFAYLSEDKSLLKNLQEDGSYISLRQPKGKYRYIDVEGNVVLQKIN